MRFRRNPAYPLTLNLVLDHAGGESERVEGVSSDDINFDRTLPFPRDGQEVGFRQKRWVVRQSDDGDIYLTEQTS